jgi:hypothetical protein
MSNLTMEMTGNVGSFCDFAGLHALLPFYSARSLRELIRRGVIPSIVLPGGRKRVFHWPSVQAALRRYQTGGPTA